MKKSNPKVKKYLSDGTEAKVGMLITYINSNSNLMFPWKTSRIFRVKLPGNMSAHTAATKETTILHEHFKSSCFLPKSKTPYYKVPTAWVRKATPEERKEYYAALNS